MNWFKENPFLSGLIAVTLFASGALGFFLYGSWSAYSEAADTYTAAIDKLHKLQNKVPYPSAANLKEVKAGLDDYKEKITALRASLSKMELPLDEKVTPQMFQDNLRAAVNAIKEKADANTVKLPDKFYLGFDRYQSEPPSALAAPQLNREMLVIESFVSRLVEYRVQSINDLKRAPLPQEVPASAQANAAGPKNKANPQAGPVLLRYPFEISFTAEQNKFRIAFNALLGSEQFIIVRSMSILNSETSSPSRKATESAAKNGPQEPGEINIKVVFGRELVKSNLSLEILDFVEQPVSKK